MKRFDCGRYVVWGFVVAMVAWTIFIATLIYAAMFVPDVPTYSNQLYTQRGGVQAGGFMIGWWLATAGFALCVIGYMFEYKGTRCLLGVVPSALYVANPWSAVVFLKFIGS